MEIRGYGAGDFEGCLRIFDSNTPPFLGVEEREHFAEFLKAPIGSYFVMESDGELFGCGGFAPEPEPGVMRLTWGLVRRDLHQQGLGRFLLFYRLKEIGKVPGIMMVRLRTSQHAAAFFEKVGGFRAVESEKDGFGPGLDRVTMLKKLTVCG
jgi:hypothetical protein